VREARGTKAATPGPSFFEPGTMRDCGGVYGLVLVVGIAGLVTLGSLDRGTVVVCELLAGLLVIVPADGERPSLRLLARGCVEELLLGFALRGADERGNGAATRGATTGRATGRDALLLSRGELDRFTELRPDLTVDRDDVRLGEERDTLALDEERLELREIDLPLDREAGRLEDRDALREELRDCCRGLATASAAPAREIKQAARIAPIRNRPFRRLFLAFIAKPPNVTIRFTTATLSDHK